MNLTIRTINTKNLFQFILSLILLAVSLLPINTKAEIGIQSSDQVTLHYFWSKYCPHCKEAKPFIESMPKKYNWLTLHSYDLVGNQANQKRFFSMADQLGQTANSVPAFIFCGQMMLGYDRDETTGLELEEKLLDCHQQKNKSVVQIQEQFNVPGLGKVHYQDFSLPVFTLIIAALDAFNPCAFFVLFFLLSLMVHHRSRAKMLVIGTTFVLCSGVMYFLFMAAWLNLFLLTNQLIYITATAGLIAIIFGLINIKDYFFLNKGISLSLSDSVRTKLFARIRNLTQTGSWLTMILATVLLALLPTVMS
jgi:thiol-disulfide isomerase/thioredoxin